MKKQSNFLYKTAEDKTIVWFENSNEYLILENTTADILKRLSKGISIDEIAKSHRRLYFTQQDKCSNSACLFV